MGTISISPLSTSLRSQLLHLSRLPSIRRALSDTARDNPWTALALAKRTWGKYASSWARFVTWLLSGPLASASPYGVTRYGSIDDIVDYVRGVLVVSSTNPKSIVDDFRSSLALVCETAETLSPFAHASFKRAVYAIVRVGTHPYVRNGDVPRLSMEKVLDKFDKGEPIPALFTPGS